MFSFSTQAAIQKAHQIPPQALKIGNYYEVMPKNMKCPFEKMVSHWKWSLRESVVSFFYWRTCSRLAFWQVIFQSLRQFQIETNDAGRRETRSNQRRLSVPPQNMMLSNSSPFPRCFNWKDFPVLSTISDFKETFKPY